MTTNADEANSDTGPDSVVTPASVVVTGPTADVVTVEVSGEVLTDAADMIARALDTIVTGFGQTVVVDMTAVTFLSLEGAAALAALTRCCGTDNRTLRVHSSPAVRAKLALTGLDTVIPLVG